MDNSERQKIDMYLLNEMDDTQRRAFEQRMANDQDFAAEVKLHKEAFDILDNLGDQRMRQKLNQIHDKVVASAPVKSTRSMVRVAIAAMVLLTGMAYYFWAYKAPATPTPQKIYASYFEPYPLSFASRGDDADLRLQQVNVLYKNEQYQEALTLIDALLAQNPDGKLQFAAAMSAHHIGAYDIALGHFNTLIDSNDTLYQSQARWYAAMTALKMENTALAKTYLLPLANAANDTKKEASQQILKTLE